MDFLPIQNARVAQLMIYVGLTQIDKEEPDGAVKEGSGGRCGGKERGGTGG